MPRAEQELRVLEGVSVLSLALNLPGPVAAARLRDLGALVTKLEPPLGDPFERYAPGWYAELHRDLRIERLDLKTGCGRRRVEALLEDTDLLLISMRPAARERLGIGSVTLSRRFRHLSTVAIVGSRLAPESPGHDLSYQARVGLLDPPHLPRTLVADLAGAERAVSAALSLLLGRERGYGADEIEVSLEEAAREFALPRWLGLTAPEGLLGGGFAGYGIYRTADGWIAVAALEAHFWERLLHQLEMRTAGHAELAAEFSGRAASWWEDWAAERDLPLVAVQEAG